jgi:hypothetical protein
VVEGLWGGDEEENTTCLLNRAVVQPEEIKRKSNNRGEMENLVESRESGRHQVRDFHNDLKEKNCGDVALPNHSKSL